MEELDSKQKEEVIRDFLKCLGRQEYYLAVQAGEPEGEAIPYVVAHIEPLIDRLIQGYLALQAPSIRAFKSIEDLIAYMAGRGDQSEEMDEAIQPWQEELVAGDCLVFFSGGLKIWGRVVKVTDPEDQAYYKAHPELLLVECFSVACREGELGNIHRAIVRHKVSLEKFQAAVNHLKDGSCHGNA
jgi:hypothetical protein